MSWLKGESLKDSFSFSNRMNNLQKHNLSDALGGKLIWDVQIPLSTSMRPAFEEQIGTAIFNAITVYNVMA